MSTPTVWTYDEWAARYPEVAVRIVAPFSQTWAEGILYDAEGEHALDYWGADRQKGIGLWAAHTIIIRTAGAGVGNGAGAAGGGIGPTGMPTISEKVGDLSRTSANPFSNAIIGRGGIGALSPDMATTSYGREWLSLQARLGQGFLVTF